MADAFGEGLHRFEIGLGERVFDRHDRVGVHPALEHEPELLGREVAVLERQRVAAAGLLQLRRGDVQRDRHVLAGPEARVLNRPCELDQAFLVRLEGRPVAAFVGHALQRAFFGEPGAGGVVDLGGHLERLGECSRAGASHHVVLQVHAAAGVRAATKDLDLRHRHRHAPAAGEVLPERQAGGSRGGVQARKRHRHDGIAAELRLVRGAVQLDHGRIHRSLVGRVHAAEGCRDRAVDVAHGLLHVEAAQRGAAVAQFLRLAAAGRGAGGGDGAAQLAGVENDFCFDRRFAARVPDPAGVHFADEAH